VTADGFFAQALPLLLEDEARHNLLLGVAGTVRDRPGAYAEARFWFVDGAAGMQTPPRGLILARPRDRAALERLVAAIDVELPGVVGAIPEVNEFVELWGRPSECVFSQGIYELDEVVPPARAPGEYREAGEIDFDLVFDWFTAFADEALHGRETIERGHIEARLASPEGGIGLWEDDHEVVSMCGYGSPTPNGVRIGPVYTPPELRGRGYATSLTAEVSERRVAAGRRFCFLYTDLANPTSNAIYERIGYRRICESAEYRFREPPADSSSGSRHLGIVDV
jgi:ribosomal protein S18 acetylase RimI-like enzyme